MILDAATEVLLADGAGEVTAARVAEHADVARTTIYRHWPDQGSLLLATIDDLASPHAPPSNEGDLEVDLRSTLASLRVRLTTRETRLVFGALASQAHHSETFREAQYNFVSHLTEPIQAILEAAIERGELAADCDCKHEALMLVSPVLHQHLMLYGNLTDDFLAGVADPWLAAHCGR